MTPENNSNEATSRLKALYTEHGITFGDGKFEMHMNLANAGVRVDSFAITWPSNPIDGKRVARQVDTPKKKMGGWGEGVICFYLVAEEKTPEFHDMGEFIKYYANRAAKPPEPPVEPAVRVKLKKPPTSKPGNDE